MLLWLHASTRNRYRRVHQVHIVRRISSHHRYSHHLWKILLEWKWWAVLGRKRNVSRRWRGAWLSGQFRLGWRWLGQHIRGGRLLIGLSSWGRWLQ